jgi:hypothetical protein
MATSHPGLGDHGRCRVTIDQNPNRPHLCPPWCTGTGPGHARHTGVRIHSNGGTAIDRPAGVCVTLKQREAFGAIDDPTICLAALTKPAPGGGQQIVSLAPNDAVATLADILDALNVGRPNAVNKLADTLRAQAALAADTADRVGGGV